MNVLAISFTHDANFTILSGNKLSYTELEKVTNIRYFSFSKDLNLFTKQLETYVLPHVKELKIDRVLHHWVWPDFIRKDLESQLKSCLPEVDEWIEVHHHEAHAWSAYMFTDAKLNDLIISNDGGGDLEDNFKIYEYTRQDIHLIEEIDLNLGTPYRILGEFSKEISSGSTLKFGKNLGMSGKIMALATYGTVLERYTNLLYEYYRNFKIKGISKSVKYLMEGLNISDTSSLSIPEGRDILASSQKVFEDLFLESVGSYIENQKYKRVILVGGCALNVTLNTKIFNKLGKEIYIPPCPNDCGISLGMLRKYYPGINRFNAPFTQLKPKNLSSYKYLDNTYKSTKGSIRNIAKYIAEGKIVATFKGEIEIGPRALGHRSLLANPICEGMKGRLNGIKKRKEYRPVAPIVLLSKYAEFFETTPYSPYMSFAPKIKLHYREILKEIAHKDFSSRVQVVNDKSSWISELLEELEKSTQIPIIMNTSFNDRGYPIVNDLKEAIKLFENEDIDCLLIEDTLFIK